MNPTGTQEELATAMQFAGREKLAVLSTVTPAGAPEAALMGIAVTSGFEIVFDTVRSSRKYANLSANPRAALVIGCSSGTTVQYEGVAEELLGDDLEKYLPVYFAAFPDGPERRTWPGITYFVVRPKWLRFCDYGQQPPRIREFAF